MGWIGVDLDSTLAFCDGPMGYGEVGPPVPKMLARVKAWLAEGREVRIFTARADGRGPAIAIPTVRAWVIEHVGVDLPITCSKDSDMVELWDDRAVGVVPNTGERADGKE